MRYINPEADFSYIRRVAILPFNNLGGDRNAGERVRGFVTIDLLSRGVFDVVERGEVSKVVRSVLRGGGYSPGAVAEADNKTLKLIGEKLNVQAVILGSVDEYGAMVELSMRMVDASSAVVLWEAKSTVRSTSFFRKIIGIDPLHRSPMTRKAVRQVLDTLL
ncbi:MAG: hypothetical protein V3W31_00130 [Thermodesulfobacteriota bacterium]